MWSPGKHAFGEFMRSVGVKHAETGMAHIVGHIRSKSQTRHNTEITMIDWDDGSVHPDELVGCHHSRIVACFSVLFVTLLMI